MDQHIKTFQEWHKEGLSLLESVLMELADYKCRCSDLEAQLADYKRNPGGSTTL